MTLREVLDMDFETFDALLRVVLQVEASGRAERLRLNYYGSQIEGEAVSKEIKRIMGHAFPEMQHVSPTVTANDAGGVRGLKKFLAGKGLGKKVR